MVAVMTHNSGIQEYLDALLASRKYGPQVVSHRSVPPNDELLAKGSLPLCDRLMNHLSRSGIKRLYSHQAKAIKLIQEGHDLIAATPTASGKSMIYNIPVVDMLAQGELATSLYIFPLKALAQDQLRVFESYQSILPEGRKRYAAIFDGDTSPYQRRRIREEGVPVVMTNPEMLHLSLLPYHGNWRSFFQSLRFVIIDEVHTYRGVLGSHMAWIIRRLNRIASSYGAKIQFILLSATIGNPAELGEKLIGRRVELLSESGAPTAKKHIALLNPWDSAAYTASQLLEASVKRGLRTIVYTQSRKMTELINLWTQPKLGELQGRLSSYRAGFLPEERRDIEQKLSSGELLGVISTSALELGIDIGDLDLCILVGYPGSIMATWQRGGRVGRARRESAIILVAQEDALDQYFMRKPEDFFAREVESAPLNPFNLSIMAKHLHCMCAESPLKAEEPLLLDPKIQNVVEALTRESVLLQAADGLTWFSTRKFPQQLVSLRGGGNQLTIIDGTSGEIIGEVDANRAMKECHPGALYLHRASTWIISRLDFEGKEVVATQEQPNWFTRAMTNKNTKILGVSKQGKSFRSQVFYGPLRVTEQVTGYQKRNNKTQKLIATLPLDLPEQTIETEGFWLNIPAAIKEQVELEKLHFMGAIHALEHAMIAMFPLLILCDRNDIGGISCPLHEETGEATIFVYDGHSGGVGLCEEAFENMDDLLRKTREMVVSCSCENGCPSCVHSPKCGSGNRPIDKIACTRLMELLLDDSFRGEDVFVPQRITEGHISTEEQEAVNELGPIVDAGMEILPQRYGVFDLETIRSAEEVGGWNRAERMGVSVAVVWDSLLGDHVTYLEDEVDRLIDHLFELDLVVGFNNKRFDNQVLSGYTVKNLNLLPSLDLLEEVHNQLGYRLSLDRIAEFTLGRKKTADGLQALAWYKEGRIDLIREYCKKDVEVTRDLFHFGMENNHFLFCNKAGKVVRLPLNLPQTISRLRPR